MWGSQNAKRQELIAKSAPNLSTLYTIGHSTRTLDELVAALRAHGIATLVDIRAFPMSRRMPHFNRESLEVELLKRGIGYVWMKELGGHRKKIRGDSPNSGLRNDSFRNYADYMLTPEFAEAVHRLLAIARETADPLRHAQGRLSTPAAKTGLPPVGMTIHENSGPALSPKSGEEDGAPVIGMTPENSASPTLSAKAADKDGAPGGSSLDISSPNNCDNLIAARTSGNTAYMCAERVYFQCHRMLVSDYLTAHGHTVLHIDDEKRAPRPHKLMAEAQLVDGQLLYNAQQLF